MIPNRCVYNHKACYQKLACVHYHERYQLPVLLTLFSLNINARKLGRGGGSLIASFFFFSET